MLRKEGNVLKRKKRRLKKNIKNALKASGYLTFMAVAGSIPNMIDVSAESVESVQPATTNSALPVYNVDSSANVSKSILKTMVDSDNSIDESKADLSNSNLDISNLNSSKSGLQMVNINANIASKGSDEKQNVSQQAVVVVKNSRAPTLSLKSNEITIDNDGNEHHFLPENYIEKIQDNYTGNLPAITYEGVENVNLKKDGDYVVKYKATNTLGYSTEKALTVHVKTPQWLIEQRQQEAEAERQKKEEEKKKEEQAKKEAEEAARQAELQQQTQVTTNTSNLQYANSGSNPYPGGWSNCTYGAWQALYNARGIALPNFGNAWDWYSNAAAAGYSVSGTPTAGSIVVYTGHVAYVDAVDGNYVHIVEGGYCGHYNERWVPASNEGTQMTVGYINL